MVLTLGFLEFGHSVRERWLMRKYAHVHSLC